MTQAKGTGPWCSKKSSTVCTGGTLIDGTEFDSSYKRGKPAFFKPGQVIRGWTEALMLMKEASKLHMYACMRRVNRSRCCSLPAVCPQFIHRRTHS